MGLAQGLSILQQGLEDAAKAHEDALKSQAQEAGNRNLLDTFVKQNIWGPKEVLEYNKGNAKFRDEMIASGARSYQIKAQQVAQQQAEESAKRARESIQLEKDRMARHVFEYDAAQKAAEAKRQQAIDFIKQGPQPFDVPVPGGGVKALLTNEGGWNLLPESPQQKENQRQADLLEKKKERSENMVAIKVGNEMKYVAAGSPAHEQYREETDPAYRLNKRFELLPEDVFNSSLHKRVKQVDKGYEGDPNGPLMQIQGAKNVMPLSQFEKFKKDLTIAGLAPPPQANATPASSGYSLFKQPISTSMPAWQRQSGGAAATPTPATVAGPIRINSDEDYNKLKSGTPFIGPDGIPRTKP